MSPVQSPFRFPFCADCQAQKISSGEVKLLFLVATTKNLSPWANQNLASGRIYCHLLVRGNYLFLPFFGGMCFRGFIFWFGAKGIHSFYLLRCSLSYKSVLAFSYFKKRGRKPLYMCRSLDQESVNFFCKGLDSKYFRFVPANLCFVFTTL